LSWDKTSTNGESSLGGQTWSLNKENVYDRKQGGSPSWAGGQIINGGRDLVGIIGGGNSGADLVKIYYGRTRGWRGISCKYNDRILGERVRR